MSETRLHSLVAFLLLATCAPALLRAQPAPASAPASAPVRKPYDPLTSKTMTGDWGGVRTALEEIGISLRYNYNQQFQHNARGGLDTHNACRLSGTADFQYELDFEKMKLLKGASFFMESRSSYGNGINDAKVGAFFDPNGDVEGYYPFFVNKWWYRQRLLDDKLEFRLGMLQTNKDLFDVSPYANHEDRDFLDRLAIRDATVPHRTGMGAYVKVQPVDWFYAQAAAVDAQSRDRRTGFDTAFHDEDWFLGMWEFGFTPRWESSRGPMPGRYRIGWWYDPRAKQYWEDDLDGRRPPSFETGDMGLYLGADQMVWKENADPKDTQGLGVFARYGVAHGDVNRIDQSWEVGASWMGLIPARDADVTAFAFSQGIFSESYGDHEAPGADRTSVYEWYYMIQVTPWCFLTPDVQVIVNPAGDDSVRDAVVAGLRLRIIF